MVEANEDISIVVERQVHDVEVAKAQATAIAEGREVHPAVLAAQAQASYAAEQAQTESQSATAPAAQSIQQPAGPPPDPDAAMRHFRLSIAVVVGLALFLLWCRQRRAAARPQR